MVNVLLNEAPIMAKETKTKRRSAAMAPYRGAGPMMKRGKKGGARKGGSKQSSETQLKNFAIGGAIVGFLTKPGGVLAPDSTTLAKIPGHETLGGEGVLAIATHLFGKGKSGTVTNIRNAAAAIAVANMVKTKA
jgi:hypothetical protein